jgi:hypothetical protein
LQSSSKALLKEKQMKRHCKRKSSRLWPGGTEALISLFEGQFISCKDKLKKNLGSLWRRDYYNWQMWLRKSCFIT